MFFKFEESRERVILGQISDFLNEIADVVTHGRLSMGRVVVLQFARRPRSGYARCILRFADFELLIGETLTCHVFHSRVLLTSKLISLSDRSRRVARQLFS